MKTKLSLRMTSAEQVCALRQRCNVRSGEGRGWGPSRRRWLVESVRGSASTLQRTELRCLPRAQRLLWAAVLRRRGWACNQAGMRAPWTVFLFFSSLELQLTFPTCFYFNAAWAGRGVKRDPELDGWLWGKEGDPPRCLKCAESSLCFSHFSPPVRPTNCVTLWSSISHHHVTSHRHG